MEKRSAKHKHAKVNKKKIPNIKKLLLIIVVITIMIIIIKNIFVKIILSSSGSVDENNAKDVLNGSWSIDGNTIYKFDGEGNGALIVPSSKYVFKYDINDNKVYIDFETDEAKDSSYEFAVNKNVLTITGIEQTVGTYTLTKQE